MSASNVKSVKKYILDQKEHHRKMSFQEEYLALLTKNGVDFDPKYVFD